MPRPPEVLGALEACRAGLARYAREHGRYPPALGYLPDVAPGLARGLYRGYVIRYAAFRGRDGRPGARWGLRADPVPPRPGYAAFAADAEGVRRVQEAEPLEPPEGGSPGRW